MIRDRAGSADKQSTAFRQETPHPLTLPCQDWTVAIPPSTSVTGLPSITSGSCRFFGAVADGRVYTGCNIEHSVYSLTMCAERVAIFKAVSEGARGFVKIAVVADYDRVTPPCGCCRQSLWEFAGPGTKIILANLVGQIRLCDIEDLLPLPFDASFLEETR